MAKTNGSNGHAPADPQHRPATFLKAYEASANKISMGQRDPQTNKMEWILPNWGAYPVSHITSFQSLVTSAARVYRQYDEALKHSLDNARYMRNDCGIMECLEARQRCVSLLNWHLEPEDDRSHDQKELCSELTKILKRIRRFVEYQNNLLHATWYGKYAVQHQYGWQNIGGHMRLMPTGPHQGDIGWSPIHGDKLCFRFDDGSLQEGQYDGQVGIRVGAAYNTMKLLGDKRKIETTDRGMAYFIDEDERRLLAIHKHMIEDGEYEDAISAGKIHGVGIRSRIYWEWVQKQETLGFLMEYLERCAGGIQLWAFPAGNTTAKKQVEQAINEFQGGSRNVIMVPIPAGDDGYQYGVQCVEPGMAGIDMLKDLVDRHFGHRMKRYILGQVLSSEAEATGLGSGVAEAHMDTLHQIVKYDATNLEETITFELLGLIKDWNFPAARNIHVRFVKDTETDDAKEKLEAFNTAYNMGAQIREKDVMELIGAAMPGEGDSVLSMQAQQQQQAEHQQSLMQQQGGIGSGGVHGIGLPGQDGNDEGEFGDDFPPDNPPGSPPSQPLPPPDRGGKAEHYAAFNESEHPRGPDGQFIDRLRMSHKDHRNRVRNSISFEVSRQLSEATAANPGFRDALRKYVNAGDIAKSMEEAGYDYPSSNAVKAFVHDALKENWDYGEFDRSIKPSKIEPNQRFDQVLKEHKGGWKRIVAGELQNEVNSQLKKAGIPRKLGRGIGNEIAKASSDPDEAHSEMLDRLQGIIDEWNELHDEEREQYARKPGKGQGKLFGDQQGRLAWNEEDHPRVPAGSPAGGEFANAEGENETTRTLLSNEPAAEQPKTRGKYQWKLNRSDKWAWFEGDKQISGATPNETDADRIFDAHRLKDDAPEEPAPAASFKDHPEYERLNRNYGNMTKDEIDAKIAQMSADISQNQHVARREFNGNGGRRTGAAVSAQAAREIGEEKLLLGIYRDDKFGKEQEQPAEEGEQPANPFRQQADELQKKIDRLTGGSAHDQAMQQAFPLGTGRPGNASSRQTSKRSDQRIEKTIDDAKKATELIGKRNALEAQAEAFDAGRIDARGNPTQEVIAEREAKAQKLAEGKQSLKDFYRATIKPGDEVHLADNPNNTVTVKRVNPTGITSDGGSKWSYDEILPRHPEGRAMTAKETIQALKAWKEQQQPETEEFQEQPNSDAQPQPEAAPEVPASIDEAAGKETEPETKPQKSTVEGPHTLDRHGDIVKRLRTGDMTPEEWGQHWENFKKSVPGIREELSKRTMKQLAPRGAGGRKKAEVVESIIDNMTSRFTAGEGYSFSPPFGQGREAFDKAKHEAIDAVVKKLTPEHFQKLAEGHAAAKADYEQQKAAHEKAIADPQTLEDFKTLVADKGEAALTPEQAEKYDDLQAEARRSRDREKKATVQGYEGGEAKTGGIGIVKGHHQKRNQETHTVTVENRLGTEGFQEALRRAKQLGGSYVNAMIAKRYGATAGFQFFNEDNAKKFADVLRGESADRSDSLEEREASQRADRAESLGNRAESLEERANETLGQERLTNTARRADMAASANARARAQQAEARTLAAIGQKMAAGELKHLNGVKAMTHMDTLNRALHLGRYKRFQDQSRQSGSMRYEDFMEEPHGAEDVAAAQYPYPSMWTNEIRETAKEMSEIPGLKRIAQSLAKTGLLSPKFQGSVSGFTASGGKVMSPQEFEQQVSGAKLHGIPEGKSVRVHASYDWRLAEKAGGAHKLPFYTADKGKTWGTTPVNAVAGAYNKGSQFDLVDQLQERRINFDDPKDIEQLATAASKLRRAADPRHRRIGERLADELTHYNRLQAMDIKSPAELRAALREYLPLKSGAEKEDPVKVKERALIGQKIPGFFPTPRPLIDRMLDAAGIESGHDVLEPSAGKGDILDAIRERHPEAQTTGVEQHSSLRDILGAKGHTLADSRDFLEHQGQHDRIVMNPPFENGQDMAHVRHAFEQLKPGGRLVAVMSQGPFFRGDKKSQEFRDWLDSIGGEHEDLPEGSFAGNDAFRQTGVNTRLVTINKPSA